VVDNYCGTVGTYNVTYSVDDPEGVSEELLAVLDISMELKDVLELPSNSLKAGREYVFTATVQQVEEEGQKVGAASIVVATLYSDLVCVVSSNASFVFSWDGLYLDTLHSNDPNLELFTWLWSCVQ